MFSGDKDTIIIAATYNNSIDIIITVRTKMLHCYVKLLGFFSSLPADRSPRFFILFGQMAY
jgi:hypothetical protein